MDYNYLEICPKCRQKFKVEETSQIPGFRDTEYMVCPYCKEKVRASMEYEFRTYKMEE